MATHRLLDRLIRGRLWIGVIAFALIGIVTMQLVLLKLNAGIGRSLVRETLLQRENATLSAENSEVAAGEQVEAQAEHAGMELIPSGALRFLTAHPASDVSKAAAALSARSDADLGRDGVLIRRRRAAIYAADVSGEVCGGCFVWRGCAMDGDDPDRGVSRGPGCCGVGCGGKCNRGSGKYACARGSA